MEQLVRISACLAAVRTPLLGEDSEPGWLLPEGKWPARRCGPAIDPDLATFRLPNLLMPEAAALPLKLAESLVVVVR